MFEGVIRDGLENRASFDVKFDRYVVANTLQGFSVVRIALKEKTF
jgi:hypothetical protein